LREGCTSIASAWVESDNKERRFESAGSGSKPPFLELLQRFYAIVVKPLTAGMHRIPAE
jgi:hypothetical protein